MLNSQMLFKPLVTVHLLTLHHVKQVTQSHSPAHSEVVESYRPPWGGWGCVCVNILKQ